LFYLALRKAGVPAEMHIYERGPHGVGLAPTDAVLASWAGRLKDWLKFAAYSNSAPAVLIPLPTLTPAGVVDILVVAFLIYQA